MTTPSNPADRGYLGPAAVTWPVLAHPGSLIGGLRALLIQSLHPLAMAGVAEHSDYRHRALDRLQRTSAYVGATAFGDSATAEEAAARVRRLHSRVRGVDPITGWKYSADDPDTQVWVHSVEWHSFLAAHRVFGPRLTAAEEDAYIAEGVVIAALLGAPERLVPASVAQMHEYFDDVRPHLCVGAAARDAIDFVASPPVTRELLPFQVPLRVFASAAVALVPRELRHLAGIDRSPVADAAAIAAAKPWVQALGTPVGRKLLTAVVGRHSGSLGEGIRAEWGTPSVASMRARRAEGQTSPLKSASAARTLAVVA